MGEIEWGWAAAEREIDLATKCDALMAEIALLKQRLVGYELFQEAGTQEHFGDPIWEYYDRKLWRDILYWKARAEEAEAALAGMEQPLHSRECEA